MARDASITLPFGAEARNFRLGIEQLVKLQEDLDMGPYVLWDRMRSRPRITKSHHIDEDGAATKIEIGIDGELDPPALPPLCGVKEIRAIIQLGLEGGGMVARDASSLIRSTLGNVHRDEDRLLAIAILSVAIYGALDEKPGEPEAANQESQSTIFQTERSDLPQSMATA
jgi:hypothetical protein|nr:hypothetical protein [Brucella anthropi]